MWLNQILAADEQLVGPAEYDPLVSKGDCLGPGDRIVLGFDGGDKNDATALVAIRVLDGLIQPLLIEERPTDWDTSEGAKPWFVDRLKVDLAVASAFQEYKVVGMYADVAYWESNISDWVEEHGSKVELDSGGRNKFAWDFRGNMRRVTEANEWLLSSINQRGLKVADLDDPIMKRLRAHVMHAFRRENRYGVSFDKETRDSPNKIDAYAALVAASAALRDYREKTQKKKRGGSSWGGF